MDMTNAVGADSVLERVGTQQPMMQLGKTQRGREIRLGSSVSRESRSFSVRRS